MGISIHALREEGDDVVVDERLTGQGISIHALREEGDFIKLKQISLFAHFYPRPPRGGRPGPVHQDP